MLNRLSWTGLGLLGLSLLAPGGVRGQDASPSAPAGYQAAPGLDGKPVAAQPAPAPHKHKAKVLCSKCAAAQAARMTPPGKIVGCAHSRNGVCTACAAALALPGEVVMVRSSPPVEAPGRALASSGPAPRASAMMTVASDGPMGEPTPVGVVRTNFSQGGPMPMPAMAGMGQPSMPGRAVAEAGAGPAPYLPKGSGNTNPHILGHLFGFSGIGAGSSEARMRRKAEAHAMIPYNNEGTAVDELPASAVYGRR